MKSSKILVASALLIAPSLLAPAIAAHFKTRADRVSRNSYAGFAAPSGLPVVGRLMYETPLADAMPNESVASTYYQDLDNAFGTTPSRVTMATVSPFTTAVQRSLEDALQNFDRQQIANRAGTAQFRSSSDVTMPGAILPDSSLAGPDLSKPGFAWSKMSEANAGARLTIESSAPVPESGRTLDLLAMFFVPIAARVFWVQHGSARPFRLRE